ncbi:hypothetical protein IMSAGC019_01235 [Lachnospiraceae bacterium]|nr:hypothetical protein IMSAGC019_01235 [Lachnospiraceae bacterium]
MVYNFPPMDTVLIEDIAIPKITSQILSEIIHYGRAFDVGTYGQIVFIEGYYTSLKFPQEVANSTARQARRMNYDYCVQTMAGLMKKYAPEILK